MLIPREISSAGEIAAKLPNLGEGWSLHRTRALLQQRRWTWAGSKILAADVPVSAEAAARWLPPSLRLPSTPRALVFAADYPDTALGFGYREAGVLLHALRGSQLVLHCAWMVVDDDTALILGRELLGFPKKLAQIEFDFQEPTPRAAITRRGITILSFDGQASTTPPADSPAFPFPIVNLRGIPGATPSLLLTMQPNECCHERTSIQFAISTQPSPCDPLSQLALDGTHPGRRLVVDLGHPDAPGATWVPAWPTGIVNPTWLWKAYPFRTW